MYGGLFGDLPATKNSAKKDDEAQDKKGASATTQAPAAAAAAATSPQPVRDKPDEKEQVSSIVKNVGVMGTSMAFVPTAALQRKRNKRPAAPTTSSRSIGTTTTTATSHDDTLKPKTTALSSEPVLTTMTLKKTKGNNETIRAIESVHDDPNAQGEKKNDLNSIAQLDNNYNNNNYQEEESEEIRRLHQKALLEDPYDPMVPNDLLQYWEQKAVAVQREKLERERLETLQEQNRLRLQLEKERQELEKQGNVEKLVEHRMKRSLAGGTGRGRGVSNLPAWLIEKQKKESELGGSMGQT